MILNAEMQKFPVLFIKVFTVLAADRDMIEINGGRGSGRDIGKCPNSLTVAAWRCVSRIFAFFFGIGA